MNEQDLARGFCPSCGARRMADSAALLADEVLPHQPMRQWVLSVPFPLRVLFASNPKVMTGALGIVYRVISTHLTYKAGYAKPKAQTGAVTLIQRFGGALNLNILCAASHEISIFTCFFWMVSTSTALLAPVHGFAGSRRRPMMNSPNSLIPLLAALPWDHSKAARRPDCVIDYEVFEYSFKKSAALHRPRFQWRLCTAHCNVPVSTKAQFTCNDNAYVNDLEQLHSLCSAVGCQVNQ